MATSVSDEHCHTKSTQARNFTLAHAKFQAGATAVKYKRFQVTSKFLLTLIIITVITSIRIVVDRAEEAVDIEC